MESIMAGLTDIENLDIVRDTIETRVNGLTKNQLYLTYEEVDAYVDDMYDSTLVSPVYKIMAILPDYYFRHYTTLDELFTLIGRTMFVLKTMHEFLEERVEDNSSHI
jgi:hypothetical protein